MSEDILTEGKINEFIERVAKLRKDEQYRSVAPIDIVSFAAKRMGIGSCTQELTYSAMRVEVNGDARRADELRFWIEASCGVSFSAGAYIKDWMDKFGKRFISEITREDDLPSLCDLKICDNCAKVFASMLNASIAFAESKGKVGGKQVNKCVGFRIVKYWSEDAQKRQCGCGFTNEDRMMLRSLVQDSCDVPLEQGCLRQESGSVVKEQCEQLRQELKAALADKDKLPTKLSNAERNCSNLEKELKDKNAKSELLQEQVKELEENVKSKEEKLTDLESEARRADESKEDEIIALRRTIAQNENKEATRKENVQEGLSSIHRQIEASSSSADSAELCGVLKEHLKRVFETLSDNGYAF